jgi:hypothetical protein
MLLRERICIALGTFQYVGDMDEVRLMFQSDWYNCELYREKEKREEYLGSTVAPRGFARKDAYLAAYLDVRALECARSTGQSSFSSSILTQSHLSFLHALVTVAVRKSTSAAQW